MIRLESIPILVALIFTPAMFADDKPAKPPAPSSVGRYQALIAEYQVAAEELDRAFAAAKTRSEKLVLAEVVPGDRFSHRFLNLALENPEDPLAFEALSWVVLKGRPDSVWSRAMAILLAKHVRNPKIADLFTSLEFNPMPEAEALLRVVLESDLDRQVRGRACLSLARRRLKASDFARAGEDRNAENLKLLQMHYNINSINSMMHDDPEALREEAIAFFDRTMRDFGEITSGESSLGELAKRESFAARSLNVGQVAPEIEGIDGDGVTFKLSDYRGKAILLIFCGDWCPPCRAAYPHERALAKALEGKPFALLVVNSDAGKEKLKARMAQERMPIRYWLDGSPPDGPIASTWNISGFPTVYVLDASGVIRYRSQGYKKEEIARTLEWSLKDSGHDVKLGGLAPLE